MQLAVSTSAMVAIRNLATLVVLRGPQIACLAKFSTAPLPLETKRLMSTTLSRED
jgi:hypothetical protein